MKYLLDMGDEMLQAITPQMRILDVIGSNPRKPPPHPRYIDDFLHLNSEFLRTRIQNMSDELYRRTEDPQKVDSSRADAEWKADSGLGNLVHGTDGQVSSLHLK
jgi:hypothetical protein